MAPNNQSSRILALDILRGITIAGMVLVNNPGSWGSIYAPLAHASWNGLTPTDLVFPFFMFIMGISTFISLRKSNFQPSTQLVVKIVRRTVVIFAIGLAVAWFGKFCRTFASSSEEIQSLSFGARLLAASNTFDTLRILGVMPRLALCYCAAACVAIFVKHRFIPWIIAALLALYSIILLAGNGYEFSEQNIIARIDLAVLGDSHMYHDTIDGVRLAFDPEGILSTLPAIAHVLLGFWVATKVMAVKDKSQRMQRLFIAGAILTFAGFLLSYGLPINKKIWSPTFVITTCGLASTLLALLIWIIDLRRHTRWCRFFESFGVNPLFMYVLGGVLGILFGTISIPFNGASVSIHSLIYREFLLSFIDDKTLASLLYALIFIAINWSIGYILYKKKIYIKI